MISKADQKDDLILLIILFQFSMANAIDHS